MEKPGRRPESYDEMVDRVEHTARELGYEERLRGLSAPDLAGHRGEEALTVDPSESPLWYVGGPNDRGLDLSTSERVEELIESARFATDFTNELAARQQREAEGGISTQ